MTKKYEITYANGNKITIDAYDAELKDGKLYQCIPQSKALANPMFSVLDGSKILSVEEVTE